MNIYTEIPPTMRWENWYWSFMKRSIFYRDTSFPPQTEYRLFDQFWGHRFWIVPNINYLIKILTTGRSSIPLYEGYNVILFFQLLTVLFQSICIAVDRSSPLQEAFFGFPQTILYVATFVISVGAPIVGVNQYIRHKGIVVQFSSGFYLSVVSSILTLVYALNLFVKIFRE